MPTPSWKHALRQVTAIASWLLSRTMVAGVVTTFVPIADDTRVHSAPGAPGVVIATGWVVPLSMVAQAQTLRWTHQARGRQRYNTHRKSPP